MYRVIYNGDVDHLRGAILTSDVDTGFQLLFKDKGLAAMTTRQIGMRYLRYSNYMKENEELDVSSYPTIEDQGHIMLNGPIQASIGVECGFCISFYLFGNIHRTIATPCPLGKPDVVSVPLERTIESEDGNQAITMLYAFFENAVEAHVKVKFTDVKSDFNLYGVIASRTSAIADPAFSSILFFKDEDEKMQVKGGQGDIDIPLLRSIVGVPLGSKLILQFGLFSDDNEKIVQDRKLIDVENIVHGSTTRYPIPISCGKCGIKVEIEWRCQRERNLMPKSEWPDYLLARK